MTLTFKAAETPTLELEHKAEGEAAGVGRAVVCKLDALHADGDVVRRGSLENEFAVVSRRAHSSLLGTAPPVGYATLAEEGDNLVADIVYFQDAPGVEDSCQLGDKWSTGFAVSAARLPTPQELAEFGPNLKRVILRWRVTEISPVTRPASPGTSTVCCGPECAIAAGKSCCAACAAIHEAAIRELARFERTRFRLLAADLKQRAAQLAIDAARTTRVSVADTDLTVLEANEVPAAGVPAELRHAAREAIERAAAILGGQAPAVRWFAAKAIQLVQALGIHFERDEEVWIAASGDPEDVYRVAAHETAHCLKGADEDAAEYFAHGLAALRGRELAVGPRAEYEGRVVRDRLMKGTFCETTVDSWVPGVRAGELCVDAGALYEKTEDGWRRVAALVA